MRLNSESLSTSGMETGKWLELSMHSTVGTYLVDHVVVVDVQSQRFCRSDGTFQMVNEFIWWSPIVHSLLQVVEIRIGCCDESLFYGVERSCIQMLFIVFA